MDKFYKHFSEFYKNINFKFVKEKKNSSINKYFQIMMYMGTFEIAHFLYNFFSFRNFFFFTLNKHIICNCLFKKKKERKMNKFYIFLNNTNSM